MKAKFDRDSPAGKLKSLLYWITAVRKNVEYNVSFVGSGMRNNSRMFLIQFLLLML